VLSPDVYAVFTISGFRQGEGWIETTAATRRALVPPAPPGRKADVPTFIEREMNRWQSASPKEWSRVSDRAVGFPLLVTDIKAGL
jgi:hypothetical protein